MHTPQSQAIVGRFFEALQYLIDDGRVNSRNAFCVKHGVRQCNLWKAERNPASQIFQAGWLTHLVNDYGVSARWLITGYGAIFTP
jgi:hypothetical protein